MEATQLERWKTVARSTFEEQFGNDLDPEFFEEEWRRNLEGAITRAAQEFGPADGQAMQFGQHISLSLKKSLMARRDVIQERLALARYKTKIECQYTAAGLSPSTLQDDWPSLRRAFLSGRAENDAATRRAAVACTWR